MSNHYIVALGASAGGLHALTKFFSNIPPGRDLAFVVITHIQRDRRSILAELIAEYTHMPVTRVTKPTEVLPGHVYILPENVFLTIENNILIPRLRRDDEIVNHAIDIFLTSLAQDAGKQAIAIILSGTGNDGTKGGEAIERAGGKLMVQSPHDAEFDQMPLSAIEADSNSVIDNAARLATDVIEYADSAKHELHDLTEKYH